MAVAAVRLNWDLVDHDCIPMPERWEANPSALSKRAIGLGDETFAIGLFRHHAGSERNIPIVRIGNIAALPEEAFRTRQGLMKAYLVEMRSIAGLSGSPVFVDLPSAGPPMAYWGGISDPRIKPPDPEQVNWFRYRFLGLIHGHFDIPNLAEDSVVEDDDAAESGGINTGIGIVVPAEKITETLYQSDLQQERDKIESNFDANCSVRPDAP